MQLAPCVNHIVNLDSYTEELTNRITLQPGNISIKTFLLCVWTVFSILMQNIKHIKHHAILFPCLCFGLGGKVFETALQHHYNGE